MAIFSRPCPHAILRSSSVSRSNTGLAGVIRSTDLRPDRKVHGFLDTYLSISISLIAQNMWHLRWGPYHKKTRQKHVSTGSRSFPLATTAATKTTCESKVRCRRHQRILICLPFVVKNKNFQKRKIPNFPALCCLSLNLNFFHGFSRTVEWY